MRKPHTKEYENDGPTFTSLEEHWTNLEGMMTLNKRTTMMAVLAKNKKKNDNGRDNEEQEEVEES